MFPFPFSFVAPVASGIGTVDNVYSMEFDGVDDNINCGDFSAYDNGDLSCSLWIYKTTSISIDALIDNHLTSTSIKGFSIQVDDLERLFFKRNTATQRLGSGWRNVGISLNNWHHILVTYNESANESKIYVDGSLKETTAGGSGTNSASYDLKIGSASSDAAFFTGNIDEVAVFDYTLDSDQVQEIYDATSTGKTADLDTLSTPPVAWYRMGD